MAETGYETPGRMSGATTRRSDELARVPMPIEAITISRKGDGFTVTTVGGAKAGDPMPVGSIDEAVDMLKVAFDPASMASPSPRPAPTAGPAPSPGRQPSRPMNGSAYLAS